MSRYVDLDERVTAQFYDEECEEWTMQTCTIADVLDSVCDDYTVLPSAQPEQRWIPCSERLPDGAYPVIVTWKNTDPASYYQYILGKHYVGVAHYKNGKWYWYSSMTEDVLMEYGRYDSEEFDEAIECIAWMPLPECYRGENDGQ